MEEVGKRFETGEFFLSELIYSAEVFKQVSDILEPRLLEGLAEADSQGVVVFGTPLGDIHDLGKNLVITVMRSQGFTIHDLGVDVPPHRFIDEIGGHLPVGGKGTSRTYFRDHWWGCDNGICAERAGG
jgi:5-methyltetrahydrofolate--homocysteine methyltransferase